MSRWTDPGCNHLKDIDVELGGTWTEHRLADGRTRIYCEVCGRVYGYRMPGDSTAKAPRRSRSTAGKEA